jgi:hypothetical protein
VLALFMQLHRTSASFLGPPSCFPYYFISGYYAMPLPSWPRLIVESRRRQINTPIACYPLATRRRELFSRPFFVSEKK